MKTICQFSGRQRYGAPIARPSKIVCIGLNFDDHAAESGMDIPKNRFVLQGKQSFCGPNDDGPPLRKTKPTGKSSLLLS